MTAITDSNLWADLTVYPNGLQNRIVTGLPVLLEALTRRLSTPRGGLFYDSSYGFDICAFLNARIDDETGYLMTSGAENELLQDPRVLAATTEIILGDTANPNRRDAVRTARNEIQLGISLETTLGPWQGILTVTSSSTILTPA